MSVGFIGSGPQGYRAKLCRNDYDFAVDTGAQTAYTIFTVTGEVMVHSIFGICETTMTGAGTIELGVAGNTAVLIAQTTNADLIVNEIWIDATPTTTIEQIDMTGRSFVISNGQDVIFTIAGANVTAGKINFFCIWSPLSADGNIVAA